MITVITIVVLLGCFGYLLWNSANVVPEPIFKSQPRGGGGNDTSTEPIHSDMEIQAWELDAMSAMTDDAPAAPTKGTAKKKPKKVSATKPKKRTTKKPQARRKR